MYDLNEMRRCTKILIIHHDDMDGYVGASTIYRYLLNNENFKKEDISFYEASYAKPFDIDSKIKMNTFIFVVDFTLPINKLDEWIEDRKTKTSHIVWIDHHVSSIKTYANYREYSVIHGLRVPFGFCGAELAYMYLKLGIEQRTENVIVYNGKDYDLSVEKEAEYIRKLFPKALKYVGDWDVWRWVNDPQQMGLYMNNGFNATKPANFDENDDFWMQFYTDDYPECTQTTEVINTGKVIANHEKTQNKYHVEKYGYDAVAVWYPAGSKKLPYKIIALNTAKHSSMVFDSVKNDYEIGIVFTYNEYGTTYSIYRLKLNPEKDIDCSYIAKTYGGGGHHDAAGWTIPTRNLLFLPKKEAEEK